MPDVPPTPPASGAGRHRQASRLPGPLGLAVLVGLLLLAFGVGAALIRPSLTGDRGSAATSASDSGGPSGTGGFGANAASALKSPTPSATPTTRPGATPSRTASPTPKRTPSRTPGRTSTGGGSSAQSADENEAVAITNRERAAAGCGTVTVNAKLASAARLHSQDQAQHNTMSHTGSDGSSPWDRSKRAGYANAIGENVAAGYRTPAAVMDGWMNSEGHRANILNCDARSIGVGLAYSSNGTPYWTQMFGSVA